MQQSGSTVIHIDFPVIRKHFPYRQTIYALGRLRRLNLAVLRPHGRLHAPRVNGKDAGRYAQRSRRLLQYKAILCN